MQLLYKLIIKYDLEDKHRKEINSIITKTGIVAGIDGILKTYENKKEYFTSWKLDDNKKIRTFAESLVKGLDKMIDFEKDRVKKEQIEQELEFELSK